MQLWKIMYQCINKAVGKQKETTDGTLGSPYSSTQQLPQLDTRGPSSLTECQSPLPAPLWMQLAWRSTGTGLRPSPTTVCSRGLWCCDRREDVRRTAPDITLCTRGFNSRCSDRTSRQTPSCVSTRRDLPPSVRWTCTTAPSAETEEDTQYHQPCTSR